MKIKSKDKTWQEVRVAAEVTNNKTLQDLFQNGHPIFGTDVHSLTATNMFRIIKNDFEFICDNKIHKEERNVAKAMIFKIFYGGSEFTIAMDLGVDLDEATKFYKTFFEAYPGLEENFKQTKKLALKRGWIELDTYTKKRYFFPHFKRMQELWDKAWSYYPEDYRSYSPDEKTAFKARLKIEAPELSDIWKEYMIYKGKLERAALNYRIQGTSATMTKLAVILMEKYFTHKYGVLLVVHDEVVVEFPIEHCKEKSEIVSNSMIKAGTYFCPKVPMGADSEIGDHWIH